jgi:hypothetical protein
VVSSGTTGQHDLSREDLTARVAAQAYAEAGVGPGDLGVIELARGHPLGATGVAQVVEVSRHLAGRTAALTARPDVGLTHCTGGGISGYDHAVCSIHVLAVD